MHFITATDSFEGFKLGNNNLKYAHEQVN